MFQILPSSAFWFQPVWAPLVSAQSEVTVLCLGGGLSSCRRTQRYIVMYIARGGTRILLYPSTTVS